MKLPLETDVAGVRAALAAGSRVLLLVRHAERPKIDNEDKTFGGELALTAAGEKMSVDFGKMLRGAAEKVKFAASPLKRTVETAALIAAGMGIDSPDIMQDATIGNGSAFVSDIEEVWRLFRDGTFFDKMRAYMSAGTAPGFAEIRGAADAYEKRAMELFGGDARLGVFATHDVYIAAFLHARRVAAEFTDANWPRFLDSAAIAIEPDGTRSYSIVRAGLSDRICGVRA